MTRLRGKSVMFVGDSIGRDQWESLVCLISADLPASSPKENTGGDPLSAFKLLVITPSTLPFNATKTLYLLEHSLLLYHWDIYSRGLI